MNTQFLETFVMVAEHGSMAEAARRLGVTPAAVAQRIAALEADLGTALLLRSGRRVAPTEAGRAIVAGGHRILVEVRQLRLAARADADVGELRLGAISTAMTGLLPPALHRLAVSAPGLDVFLLPGTSTEVYRQVIDGGLDAAILVRPPFVIPKSLDWVRLRTEPLVLICPEDWAGDDPLALLRARPFIRYDRNNWGGRLAERWMKDMGLTLREGLELDQLEAIAVMVNRGLGVSIVPDWAPPWPEGLRLCRLPLPGHLRPTREIGLLWPRGAPAGRLIGQVRDALLAAGRGSALQAEG